MSIGRYFTEMLDPSLDWKYVAEMVKEWGGQFCLKGLMSVEDARRAVDIGCTGIVLPTTAAASSTVREAASTSSPKSSTPSATASTS